MNEIELIAIAKQDLEEQIEKLYETFSKYQSGPTMSACEHCVSDEEKQELFSKPLSELAEDDLSRYASKAISTWGDENDFRHFLPRLFELLGQGIVITNAEVIFGKLTYGKWRTWPESEQEVIEGYFSSLWRYVVLTAEPSSCMAVDEYLCAIAQAVDDMDVYLSMWLAMDNPIAANNLTVYVQCCLNDWEMDKRLGNSFWEGRQDQMMQVVSWIFDNDISERVP